MIALIAVLVSGTAQAESHAWAAGVTSLAVTNGAGDLEVVVGDHVSVQTTLRDGNCVVEFGDRGGATVLVRPAKKHGPCVVDVAVTVPADADLRVELGAGDVEIDAPRVSATLTVGAGDVELHVGGLWAELGAGDVSGSVHGDAKIQAGAGDVDLDSLSRPIQVVAGAGDVELCFDSAPKGEIEVTAGVGDVHIDLPDGSVVHADVPRSAHNAFGSAASAPTRVDLSAGLGSVRID